MKESFPFLQLPLVPKLEVLKSLDLKDLLSVSLSSKSMRHYVKMLHLKFNFLRLTFTADGFYHLAFVEKTQMILGCEVISQPRDPRIQRAQGMPFLIPHQGPPDRSRLDQFEAFVSHCLKLFHVKSLIVTFMEPYDPSQCFVWKFKRYLVILDAWSLRTHTERSPRISARTMTFSLDSATSIGLTVRGKVEKGFRYSNPLKTNLAVHDDVKWLEFAAVLNMESNFVQIEVKDHFNNQQINQYLRKWVSGVGLNKVAHFQMKTEAIYEEEAVMKLEEILDGLDVEIVENEAVIRRKDDKKSATVHIKDGVFRFIVKT